MARPSPEARPERAGVAGDAAPAVPLPQPPPPPARPVFVELTAWRDPRSPGYPEALVAPLSDVLGATRLVGNVLLVFLTHGRTMRVASLPEAAKDHLRRAGASVP